MFFVRLTHKFHNNIHYSLLRTFFYKIDRNVQVTAALAFTMTSENINNNKLFHNSLPTIPYDQLFMLQISIT